MPLKNIEQPEVITVGKSTRLRKYDGKYEKLLKGYQDPYVYQNSEGIFDDDKKPDLNYVKGMCEYLDKAGELYFIEVEYNGRFISVGDVTIKAENPPISIWDAKYRGIGLGTEVMRAVICRLKILGYKKVTGSTVYKWNIPSKKMHERLGFVVTGENENEWFYDLDL